MYQARTGQFIYQVRDGDKILWVRREEVVEEHAVELCEFYEKRITWKAK